MVSQQTQRKIKKQLPQNNSSTSMEIKKAIDSYILHHHSRKSSKKTITWHTFCLGCFHTFCLAHNHTHLDTLTLEDLQTWIVEMTDTPGQRGQRASRTVSWYARSLRAFWRWCVKRQFVETDLTEWLEMPKLDKILIRIVEPEDFHRLTAACFQSDGTTSEQVCIRNEVILWVLYDTGIRLGELCGLQLKDYDADRDWLIVRGKGQKERKITIGHNASIKLKRYLSVWRDKFPAADYDTHLFLHTEGALTSHGVQSMIRRLSKRAGFDDKRIYPHLFRHSFAVRFLMMGGDIFSLQELLGHEDMETIRNYLHLADTNIQTQKKKFSPGDELSMVSHRKQKHRKSGR
jgi:integrase/recombinase XerD